MMGSCRLRIVQHLDRIDDRLQCALAVGDLLRSLRELNADAVLRDRDGGDRQLIVVEGSLIQPAALVVDQQVGVEDQSSSHGFSVMSTT